MSGDFSNGFSNGFSTIGGYTTMANIQTISYNTLTALTAVPYASGTITISGVADDKDVNIFFDPLASGTYMLKAGAYCNGIDGDIYTTIADSVYYAVDGSKHRQADGTIQIEVNNSGNMYVWQK